jgi:hypothetical protein
MKGYTLYISKTKKLRYLLRPCFASIRAGEQLAERDSFRTELLEVEGKGAEWHRE